MSKTEKYEYGGAVKSSNNPVGLRCRARWQMRTHAWIIDASCCGTVVSETENLGRWLFQVRWDNDVRAYVFPHEIEFLSTEPFAYCL